MIVKRSSDAVYKRRCFSSIRLLQKPIKLAFKGSGLPVPSKGVRKHSKI